MTYMEFTTLIIVVGHLDPDIPLTNVQVSVTQIMLWRVFWFRVFMFRDVGPNSSKTHLLTSCMILDLKNIYVW